MTGCQNCIAATFFSQRVGFDWVAVSQEDVGEMSPDCISKYLSDKVPTCITVTCPDLQPTEEELLHASSKLLTVQQMIQMPRRRVETQSHTALHARFINPCNTLRS
jgi:hypothetical protein